MMDEEFETALCCLLQKHFGEKWEFNWESQEDGFDLQLWVWGQPTKEET